MFSAGEFEKLGRLLNNLHICMDIKFGLLDVNAREVYTAAYRTPFCRLIAQAEGGYARAVPIHDVMHSAIITLFIFEPMTIIKRTI